MPRTALTETSASKLNKRTATDLDESEPQPSKKPKKADSSEKLSASNPPEFLSHVTLDGEEANAVPVYDDCNQIRRKIRNYLEGGVKVTHFLKWIDVNPGSYRSFMNKTGINEGCGNITFYSAYVFFEKKRIFEKKAKTDLRRRQEEAFPRGRELDSRRNRVWLGPGESASYDRLGQIVIHSRGRR